MPGPLEFPGDLWTDMSWQFKTECILVQRRERCGIEQTA